MAEEAVPVLTSARALAAQLDAGEVTPGAVAEASFDFLDDIGLHDHLSSQRNNGLEAMIDQMKKRAQAFQN